MDLPDGRRVYEVERRFTRRETRRTRLRMLQEGEGAYLVVEGQFVLGGGVTVRGVIGLVYI